MAALENSELVKIVINDRELEVPKGELIVESVKRLGLEIPIFCYHPRMKPVGMCRMCLVEVGFKQPDGTVRKMPKPQAGCTMPASEGMVIYTDSEMVHADRKGVLEFLLINHPLDCPICDRGGECPLQNNTIFYGPSTSRFTELKRHADKAVPLSKHVTLDLERCIQCGRCVRFTEEISGDGQLAFRFRGASMQPSTFKMSDFDSKFSGNVIEICPVGALTSTTYRFAARPWDLQTKPGICVNCSNGCNVWFDYRSGNFVRLNGRTNESINEEWTCDKGKFGHEWYNSARRLKLPMLRKGNQFVPVSWADAYDEILTRFKSHGNRVGALVGGTISNEGLFLLQKMFRTVFNSNNLDYRWTKNLQAAADRLESRMKVATVQSSIEGLETKSSLLVFGTSLADELPMIYLRARKAATLHGCKVIVAHSVETETEGFASHILRYREGTENVLAAGMLAEAWRSGKIQLPEAMHADLQKATLENVSGATGIPASLIQEAVSVLGENGAVITSQSMFNWENAQSTEELLAGLAMSAKMEFNCFALGGNDQGAEMLGILPDSGVGGTKIRGDAGLGTHQMLTAAAKMKLDALWLVEANPLEQYADSALAARALENVEFLVYQGSIENEAMQYASLILPMEAPAEMDGTYTNCEKQVQRMSEVMAAPGDSKQAWRIFGEVILRATGSRPYFNAGDVFAELCGEVKEFKNLNFQALAPKSLPVGKPVMDDVLVEVN